jgi:hypothetical protein
MNTKILDIEGVEELSIHQGRFLETAFCRGACHAANWLNRTAREQASQGKPTEAILDNLSDLEQVLMDWRNGHIKNLSGNPWDWSEQDLTQYIVEHREGW